MTRALIGHTGFVGGNIGAQSPFDTFYNSSNVEALAERSWDLIVCAGAPGVKWKANREPERDRASIDRLKEALTRTRADHVVLISTVDVYPTPVDVDEETAIDVLTCAPYGAHRLELERFVADRFDATVIRLPGLFGPGLKKNVIFDVLQAHGDLERALEHVSLDSAFQFYSLVGLWADVERVREAAIPVINFATEPVSVRDVLTEGFGLDVADVADRGTPVRYDFRTVHAAALGGEGAYIQDRARVLADLRTWLGDSGWRA